MNHYIIFDTETTGLVKSRDLPLNVCPKIIELYAMKVDENMNLVDEIDLLIDPDERITDEITKITGITNEMVRGKGTIIYHWQKIERFMYATDIAGWIGHNVTFDSDMMFIEWRRASAAIDDALERHHIGMPLWCSVEWCELKYGRRIKLSDLHQLILGEALVEAHRAKNDVVAVQKILRRLLDQGEDLELPGQFQLANLIKGL